MNDSLGSSLTASSPLAQLSPQNVPFHSPSILPSSQSTALPLPAGVSTGRKNNTEMQPPEHYSSAGGGHRKLLPSTGSFPCFLLLPQSHLSPLPNSLLTFLLDCSAQSSLAGGTTNPHISSSQYFLMLPCLLSGLAPSPIPRRGLDQ